MNDITTHIINIDKNICRNIEKFNKVERGLLAQNILSQLRNFVEHIALKIYEEGRGTKLNIDYENIQRAIEYIKARGDLKFLSRLHKLLQISSSHYTIDEEGSERLVLKYLEYLIRIKVLLKSKYDLHVLNNLEKFPISNDSSLKEYYEKIAVLINQPNSRRLRSEYKDRYYIQKIKPFFVNEDIYYEVTFQRANDYTSKFDRIIAFTKLDILSNYAVRLSISIDYVDMLNKRMPIQIIDDWEVSIRPCELYNFAKIFGMSSKIDKGQEYTNLMRYITVSGLDLVELVDLDDWYFERIKYGITQTNATSHISKLLDKCREVVKSGSQGSIVIRYLLFRLNNKIIKKQYSPTACSSLSNLYLSYKCIPFDQMPFNSSLVSHNPKLSNLYSCISVQDRNHEILARLIKNNTEQKGQLYTSLSEIEGFQNLNELIDSWNDKLYWKHKGRAVEQFNNHLFIKGFEEETVEIIRKLKEISSEGIRNYSNSVSSWLQSNSYAIDCEEKKSALIGLFDKSKLALIYGAAGTGKSTMINHISNFFYNENKLYLANTNPAIDNLKRNVKISNSTFKTISKYLSKGSGNYDILIIDECSTVSNADMLAILNRSNFKLLILVGDVYQIESILFGNWFILVRYFIKESSVSELTKTYRSNSESLLKLWQRVRDLEDSILETLTRNEYSRTLDSSIFQKGEDDEIILCLNYDGLYGINNINSFLQSSNDNLSFVWGTHTYKVNDPIIFNESGRFAPLIYNNLKGRIYNIELLESSIQFEVEVCLVINELDAEGYDFELLDNAESGYSIIRFRVDKYQSSDEDDDNSLMIMPIQVAYAVSIHKAQGLEYNSVKIVISDEVDELITHSIFYTAITRAKKELKIYWSPESEKKILEGFKEKFNPRDFSLLKKRYAL